MDYQAFADGFQALTCIMAVQKKDDGTCGEIRIAAANKSFIESVLCPADADGNRRAFIPHSRYDEYMQKDLQVEDLCFRTAVYKDPIHTYVHPRSKDYWVGVFIMPLECDENGLFYCSFTLEPSRLSNVDLMSTHFFETSADVLKTCIKLHDTNDFQNTLREIIRDIRAICDAEVCTLMLTDSNAGKFEVLATDIKAGSSLKSITQSNDLRDIAAAWQDMIEESGCLIVKSEQDMQYLSQVNHPWYLTLTEAGVRSIVLFPLRHNQEVLGFIWATNFDTDTAVRIKETLELTTFFLSSEIASYRMMQRLEIISFTDLLTGIRNRNAMNHRIASIATGEEAAEEPFGVIFADLNGLKQVNDCFGHQAGDLLLKRAAVLLQEFFPPEDIFRAGGDEFMILVKNCTEEEFREKTDLLRERANDPQYVSLAVGGCYAHSGKEVHTALREADEEMYRIKEALYREHPELKYR